MTGRAWYIRQDNIDTDMIYHNKHLAVTDKKEMGKYALGNLEGYENFARKVRKGDILFAGRNFGSGSSRQQAVDCFVSLGVQCIVAESFGAIYERNAINAAFPVLVTDRISDLDISEGDEVSVDFSTGRIVNKTKNKTAEANPFSEVQMEIYRNGGLF